MAPQEQQRPRQLVQEGIQRDDARVGHWISSAGMLLRLGGKNLFHLPATCCEETGHSYRATPARVCYARLALGGLSNHWTGGVPRFAPEDFTEGERLHERFRWPISYAELAPYYEKVELAHADQRRRARSAPAARRVRGVQEPAAGRLG